MNLDTGVLEFVVDISVTDRSRKAVEKRCILHHIEYLGPEACGMLTNNIQTNKLEFCCLCLRVIHSIDIRITCLNVMLRPL